MNSFGKSICDFVTWRLNPKATTKVPAEVCSLCCYHK